MTTVTVNMETKPEARRVINLMSDTSTLPTQRMREIIANAPCGDDVYGLDPSVKSLEETAARLLGKEAAIFVPSGTMSNLIAVGTHCGRGDEILLGDKSHIITYEGGGSSAYMGVSFRTVPNLPDGTMRIEDLEAGIRDDDIHYPRTTLVAIENTQNICGGRVLPVAWIRQVEAFCHEHNLKLHVDGARLANASIASGVPMADLVRGADSVSLCVSKGLGAPIGSVLAGSAEFIRRANRIRKSLGGGMRQSGLVAAAGQYALEHQFQRLADDHKNAKRLAEGLSQIPGIVLNPDDVDSNIVFFKIAEDAKLNATQLIDRLEEKNIIVGAAYRTQNRVRVVTSLNVTAQDMEDIITAVQELMT